MLEQFTTRVVDGLCESGLAAREDAEIYQFGLEAVLLKTFHLLTMLTVGFLVGMVLQTMLFIIFFSFLRVYAGGFHAKTKTGCWMISWAMTAAVLLGVKACPPVRWISPVGVAVCSAVIAALAPLGCDSKPLDAAETRHYRKTVLILVAVYAALSSVLFWTNWSFQISFLIFLSELTVSASLILRKLQLQFAFRFGKY